MPAHLCWSASLQLADFYLCIYLFFDLEINVRKRFINTEGEMRRLSGARVHPTRQPRRKPPHPGDGTEGGTAEIRLLNINSFSVTQKQPARGI